MKIYFAMHQWHVQHFLLFVHLEGKMTTRGILWPRLGEKFGFVYVILPCLTGISFIKLSKKCISNMQTFMFYCEGCHHTLLMCIHIYIGSLLGVPKVISRLFSSHFKLWKIRDRQPAQKLRLPSPQVVAGLLEWIQRKTSTSPRLYPSPQQKLRWLQTTVSILRFKDISITCRFLHARLFQ